MGLTRCYGGPTGRRPTWCPRGGGGGAAPASLSSRVALHDNCSPWLTFLVQITFEESRNYTDHDRGLLTFLKKGDAEDWRLEEVLLLLLFLFLIFSSCPPLLGGGQDRGLPDPLRLGGGGAQRDECCRASAEVLVGRSKDHFV